MKLRIREVRKDRGLTQRDLADLAGMSQSYLTEIENGKKQINAHRLENIARALGVLPRELILDDDNPHHVELLRSFDRLDDDQKALVVQMAATLAAKR